MKNPRIERILEISKELGLSHIGSCISVLPILEEIYAKKKSEDLVIFDNAHAHLAHLIIKESEGELDFVHIGTAEDYIKKYGIHCDRKAGCDASGGSLGHGIGISIGFALANPKRAVHCVVSDGSMMEGSNWEALRIINDLQLHQIHIYCNFNGYTAVSEYNTKLLAIRMGTFTSHFTIYETDNGEGFSGVQ